MLMSLSFEFGIIFLFGSWQVDILLFYCCIFIKLSLAVNHATVFHKINAQLLSPDYKDYKELFIKLLLIFYILYIC